MGRKVAVGTLAIAIVGCHLTLGFEDPEASSTSAAGGGTTSSVGTGGGEGGGGAGEGAGGGGGHGGAAGGGGAGGMVVPDCPRKVQETDFFASGFSAKSDEFDSAAESFARWDAAFFAQNAAGHVGSSTMSFCGGFIEIQPDAPVVTQPRSGFYWGEGGQTAPMVFQRISGDFAIEVNVKAVQANDDSANPADPFSGAGIIAYDPVGGGWVLHTLSVDQNDDIGTSVFIEAQGGTVGSQVFPDQLKHEARMVLCRTNGTFHTYRRIVGSMAVDPTANPGTFGLDGVTDLQVGITAHWFQGGPLPESVKGRFEYVTFHPGVSNAAQCQALLQ